MNLTFQDFGVTRKTATLSNGIRLVTFEKKGLPVTLRTAIVAGDRFDLIGKEGTAHFLEHMLVAGTQKFPSKDKLATFIERLGGEFGASTGSVDIKVDIDIGDPADLPQVTELLSEIINRSLFDPKTFEKERVSVQREMANWHSSPQRFLSEVGTKLFYQGTPVGRIQSEDSVAAITHDDVTSFFENRVRGGDLTFLVGGDVEIGRVQEHLENEFSGLHPKKSDLGPDLPIVRKNIISSARYETSKEIHFTLAFRTATRFDPDIASLEMIAEILGGGRAATLSRILRYEKGLIYSIGAHSSGNIDYGTWRVSSSSSKDKLNEVLKIIGEEISRVYQGGLTEEEISFAKDKIVKSSRRNTQTVQGWVSAHTTPELFAQGEKWTFPYFLNLVSAQTKGDVDRVGKKYLKPESWYLAATGDITEDEIKFSF